MADGQIRIREFFDYDDNAALRCHIIDDGFSEDRHNFSGITQQKITKCVNSEEAPAGLPEIIEEYALDLQTSGSMLLSKTVNQMDKCGRVIARDKYDSRNIKVSSESWTYNHYGQVFCYTNPLGHKYEYRYDWNGNKKYEKGLWTDSYKKYEYDLCNRLIEEFEHVSDGKELIKAFSYDPMGNRIASTDIYGQETRYEYDPFRRMTKMIQPFVINETGQAVQPVTAYAYDQMSN
ncbi:MAG: RHS repeat domain-containing protein, partial [Minisyncoccia bacterium]